MRSASASVEEATCLSNGVGRRLADVGAAGVVGGVDDAIRLVAVAEHPADCCLMPMS